MFGLFFLKPFSDLLAKDFFGFGEEGREVGVSEQVLPDQVAKVGEGPLALCPFEDDPVKQMGDQAGPDLDFNCIDVVAEKVFQGEILFQSFENHFDLPSSFVDIGDFGGGEEEDIG